MTKTVAIYLRNSIVLLRPCSQTTTGLWIEQGSFATFELQDFRTQGGKAVLNALAQSNQGMPHPTSWDNSDHDPTWRVAGATSWATFVRGACSLDVELSKGTITISPSRNIGAKDGFIPLSEKDIHLPPGVSSDQLVGAIEIAFALCEPAPK